MKGRGWLETRAILGLLCSINIGFDFLWALRGVGIFEEMGFRGAAEGSRTFYSQMTIVDFLRHVDKNRISSG